MRNGDKKKSSPMVESHWGQPQESKLPTHHHARVIPVQELDSNEDGVSRDDPWGAPGCGWRFDHRNPMGVGEMGQKDKVDQEELGRSEGLLRGIGRGGGLPLPGWTLRR